MSEFKISELIEDFLRKNQKSNIYYEQVAVQLWKTEMGDSIFRYTKSVSMQNGVLYVSLLNASLKFEMMGRKSEIIKKINEKAGVPVVKDVIFR
ncbi:DUF721 domain-containing protein [Bacteroidales bacterium OttesenSCG-928-B11]|nr:DUF721 domain-containing protein [Bacteroidales bacterium OttesenSCG-928-E04]MDL2311358.1 DUF721 domain-containing protein [Bacteroidales bacterium OttesenSCG-928-B11]MDL2326028.1 DUF721 domain-containing protein [Bacteroidales bacterium OttesenSCG-928-A14]